jgi:small multidrug resistance pump
MLSRHDAAVRSPLLAARGRLRWRLYDVLESGAVFVITRKLSPGDPGTANDVGSQQETSIHNKGDMPERTFAPRRGPAVSSVARARVSLTVPYYTTIAAPILLGIAGHIALEPTANGSATDIAQFLNPLTIIGLAILSSPPSATSWPLKRFQSQSPSPRASYAVVAVLAHILWNEPLGWPQVAGIVMIRGGVLLVRQH